MMVPQWIRSLNKNLKPPPMRKTLLLASLALVTAAAHAQVTTFVLQPPQLEGPLEFTWPAWGQTPDLNDPLNQVIGFAHFVDDGTAGDSLGCNALVNGADIAGKIALVYRGACEFGMKALNAQNAGAIAVVIINNVPGVIPMGGGAVGADVTIPVVMIGAESGALLYDEVLAGNVQLLIGSVLGVYEYNLSMSAAGSGIPPYSARPSAFTEGLTVNLGAWIRNFGSEAQSGVTLNCTITNDGNTVYNETSSAASLGFNEETYFSLPTFSQPAYDGLYEATYTINSPNTDDFPSDNTFNFNFLAEDLVAYSRIDPVTLVPQPDTHIRAVLDAPNFMICSYFRAEDAGNFQVEGLYGSSSKAAGASVQGDVLEARIYEWNGNWSGWSDATVDQIFQVDVADYFYDENLSSVPVYIPFSTPFVMADNQRYLFCVFSPATDVFLGGGEVLDYTQIQSTNDEPIYLANDNGEWISFTDLDHSSVGAKITPLVGIIESDRVELTPFPNPTAEFIRIPLAGQTGAATLQMFDLAGNKVSERRVSVGGDETLVVNVSGMSNGVYLFQMNFDSGKYSTFRVVVTK